MLGNIAHDHQSILGNGHTTCAGQWVILYLITQPQISHYKGQFPLRLNNKLNSKHIIFCPQPETVRSNQWEGNSTLRIFFEAATHQHHLHCKSLEDSLRPLHLLSAVIFLNFLQTNRLYPFLFFFFNVKKILMLKKNISLEVKHKCDRSHVLDTFSTLI